MSEETEPAKALESHTSAGRLRAWFDALPHDVRLYLLVFAVLMALLLLTVLAAMPKLPTGITVAIALAIAIVKATLVVLFFMHVKDATRVTWVFVGSAFLWLLIMLALTLADYVTRGDTPGRVPHSQRPPAVLRDSTPVPG